MIAGGGAYFALNPSSAQSKPVAHDLVLDSDNNVRILTVDIKGKPYLCNPTLTPQAEILIHCDPMAKPE